MGRKLLLGVALLVGVAVSGPVPTALAATFTVTSTADEPDLDLSDGLCLTAAGECTLRAAIQQANALGAGLHAIVLLGGATYTLTIPSFGVETDSTGSLDINTVVSISVTGGNAVVQGASGWHDRVFLIRSGASAELTGLQIAGGSFGGGSGGGGGILNEGALTLTNSRVSGNTAEKNAPGLGDVGGGGILNAGTLTLTNSTVSANSATSSFGGGGGIWNFGTLTVTSSTVSGNRTAGGGGGIWNNGTLAMTDSTVSGNSSESLWGGGIDNARGTLTLTRSTVRSNSAVSGGGVSNIEGTLTLANSTVSGNSVAIGGGGIINLGFDSLAALTVTSSTISGNGAGQYGGGIANSGLDTLTVKNSTISGNSAGKDGGGIHCGLGTVTNTTVSGNSTGRDGGGFFTCSSQTVTNGTVSDNSAGRDGGGFYLISGSSLTVQNSTISTNRAAQNGGGIGGNPGVARLNNVTIARNVADSGADGTGDGGGIAGFGFITIANTILGDNIDASATQRYPDCQGSLTSAGYNLVENTAGCTIGGDTTGNITGRDPLLGPLQDNAGPTFTHALLTRTVVSEGFIYEVSSPAIDAGNPGKGIWACLDSDQRGNARPVDANGDRIARCDIGAYESGPVVFKLGTWSLAPTEATVRPGERVTYSLTWTVPPPRGWRSLRTLELVLLDDEGITLWARFEEVAGSPGVLQLVNLKNGNAGPSFAPGRPNRLESELATVYLAEAAVDGPPGPKVKLTLTLSFKPHAAGRAYDVLVGATDDAGEVQGFHRAGTVAVTG